MLLDISLSDSCDRSKSAFCFKKWHRNFPNNFQSKISCLNFPTWIWNVGITFLQDNRLSTVNSQLKALASIFGGILYRRMYHIVILSFCNRNVALPSHHHYRCITITVNLIRLSPKQNRFEESLGYLKIIPWKFLTLKGWILIFKYFIF